MSKVKLATICCFMLALLDEVETKGEENNHIRKRCQAYIDNNPTSLDIVANKAWEVACENSSDYDEWNPAITLVMLWDKFKLELRDKVKLNTKFGEKLFNKQSVSLQCKINSKEIALNCIQAINKVMYDNKGVL